MDGTGATLRNAYLESGDETPLSAWMDYLEEHGVSQEAREKARKAARVDYLARQVYGRGFWPMTRKEAENANGTAGNRARQYFALSPQPVLFVYAVGSLDPHPLAAGFLPDPDGPILIYYRRAGSGYRHCRRFSFA